MQEFLVLGNIPGTNIQITFIMWLDTVLVLALVILLLRLFPSVRQSLYRQLAAIRTRKIIQFLNEHHLL